MKGLKRFIFYGCVLELLLQAASCGPSSTPSEQAATDSTTQSLAAPVADTTKAQSTGPCFDINSGQICSDACKDTIAIHHEIDLQMQTGMTGGVATEPCIISANDIADSVNKYPCEQCRLKLTTADGKVKMIVEHQPPAPGYYSAALILGILRHRVGMMHGAPNKFTFYEGKDLAGKTIYPFTTDFAWTIGQEYYDVSDLPTYVIMKVQTEKKKRMEKLEKEERKKDKQGKH